MKLKMLQLPEPYTLFFFILQYVLQIFFLHFELLDFDPWLKNQTLISRERDSRDSIVSPSMTPFHQESSRSTLIINQLYSSINFNHHSLSRLKIVTKPKTECRAEQQTSVAFFRGQAQFLLYVFNKTEQAPCTSPMCSALCVSFGGDLATEINYIFIFSED